MSNLGRLLIYKGENVQHIIENYPDLMVELQLGIPIVGFPFKVLGDKYNLEECDVVQFAKYLLEEKICRRFGAIFSGAHLNYRSQLCALAIDDDNLEEKIKILQGYKNITHIYQRGWSDELPADHFAKLRIKYPTIWFTYSEQEDIFEQEFANLKKMLEPFEVYDMPAIHCFKVQVIFGNHRKHDDAKKLIMNTSQDQYCEKEKRLIRYLQSNLEVTSNFFENIAVKLNLDLNFVMSTLENWHKNGTMRRLGFVPYHRRLGYNANAMALWELSEEEAIEIGRELAKSNVVTHCYFRKCFDGFPYGLYAMIHDKEWEGLLTTFEQLSLIVGKKGKLLCSIKEYKKSSMFFFEEREEK